MGFFDRFKNKMVSTGPFAGGSYIETSLTQEELAILVQQAIAVFKGNPHYNMDELVTGIKIFAGDASLALNLYYYIPAAFCRIVYPEPEYSNEIVLAKSGKAIRTHSLADDRIFKVVMEESRKSYARDNTADKIVSILVHSAEFDALNKALHAGSSLQDLGFSPSVYNL